MNENGLALVRFKHKYVDNTHLFEVILLDSALQKTWNDDLALNNQLQFVGYEFVAGNLYLLFRKGTGNRGGLHLVRIDIVTHVVTPYEIDPSLDFTLTHFSVTGNSAVLGGYIADRPEIFLYDMTTGRGKIIPGLYIQNARLLDVRMNQSNSFNALFIVRSATSKARALVMKTFDDTGVAILDQTFEIDSDKSILTGITSTLARDELMVAGTWGQPNGKMALGIFTAIVQLDTEKPMIRYYDFTQLDHFLDHLPHRKAARIKNKTRRRREKGKLPSYGLYVNTCKIDESEEGFMLLAETYAPVTGQSRYQNPYLYSPYYSPYAMSYYGSYGYGSSMNNPYAFPTAGYRNYMPPTDVTVSNSSVIVFDPEGKRKEDVSTKFSRNIKLLGLEQVSDFSYTHAAIAQVYKNAKGIHVNISQRDGSVPLNSPKKCNSHRQTKLSIGIFQMPTMYAGGFVPD